MMKCFPFLSGIQRSIKAKVPSRLFSSKLLLLNRFSYFEIAFVSQIYKKSRYGQLIRFSSSSSSHHHHPTSSHSPHNDLALEDERVFHDVADTTLEELSDLVSQIELSLDDVDYSLSQGVLNINLGSVYQNKTWVINKQTPNRQIWWSSPISGPRRFEYMSEKEKNSVEEEKNEKEISSEQQQQEESSKWLYTKDRTTTLKDLFKEEIQQVTGISLL
jgi:frataxin